MESQSDFMEQFFFLPPPQLSQSGWESLQSILWMNLLQLLAIHTPEKLASGWSPSASLLLVPHGWTGWASSVLRAPWALFNWQVGQEETTCLIVVCRPVPMKDLSSNLWRAFSHKWVVACKELTNFHWRLPGRKRNPSFWNHPRWSSWKPSCLALRVSPSVFEGVSGKLVCGAKVATPIRSLFCNAALLAGWSAAWFPCATSVFPFWCTLQWETETSVADGLPPRV